jgi:Flp pilus assembly pilin Flp
MGSILRFVRDDDGQAVVEYVLLLTISLAVMISLANGFRRICLTLWQTMTCDITAACPGCPPADAVSNKMANACAR